MARPRGDIEERVKRAARAHYLASGVDAASLRAIAKDAKTSVGMVYYYFPSKDALFLAVVEDVYETLLADLERLMTEATDARDRIVRVIDRVGRLSTDELDVIRLIVREALTSPERLSQLMERFQRGHIPLIVGTIHEAYATGVLRQSVHPGVALASLVGVGMAAQVLVRVLAHRFAIEDAPRGDELSKALAEIYFHGAGRNEA